MISRARAATLRTLVTELLELREPSRDFDGGVAMALRAPQAFFAQFKNDVDGTPIENFDFNDDIDGPECYWLQPRWSGFGRTFEAPAYTNSLDATMAAVRVALDTAVRPALVQQPDESWLAALLRVAPDEAPCPHLRGWLPGATLAACLLLAVWIEESSHEGADPELRPDLSVLVG